jgi:hypothetical protein
MEGSPNRHPGQGTACRRFFFQNAMLELLWIEDHAEAQGHPTALWRRFTSDRVSPFGIILRPGRETTCPWPSWTYRPETMPGLELEIATNAHLTEPMWCYMKAGKPPVEWPLERRQPLEHPAGFREITEVIIHCPEVKADSVAAAMAAAGVITLRTGMADCLEIQIDGGIKQKSLDFRPALPVVFSI